MYKSASLSIRHYEEEVMGVRAKAEALLWEMIVREFLKEIRTYGSKEVDVSGVEYGILLTLSQRFKVLTLSVTNDLLGVQAHVEIPESGEQMYLSVEIK